DPKKLAETIREAFVIAKTGRPGPVLIDIPKDITSAEIDFEPASKEELEKTAENADRVNLKRIMHVKSVSDKDIENAVKLINKAKRPVIYAGGGIIISDAFAELKALAEKADIPVSMSLMGKSAFPNKHALALGMIGMHGTKAANMAANQCDLLIAIGTRFSDRVIGDPEKFAGRAKVLQIDIDPAEVNKNIRVFSAIVGNIKNVLSRIVPLVEERKNVEWHEQISQWKKEIPPSWNKKESLAPKFIYEYVNSKVPEDTVITTEVGQHQMWAAQFYDFTVPRTFLTSGGLGTMGFGTGAAIGAQIANPNRKVVHFAGDGSFRMNCNELATIDHYKLPLIIVVINNGALGNVRMWQTLFYEKRYSQTTLDFGPDFVKLAEAYGISGYRATTEEEFKSVFDKALASGKAAVIDAHIEMDEMVFPMIPPGKPVENLLLDLK
ncbi:MAG: acetolactate synthase large subunit, partial [Treponema sp.]|nr:acetolactate synthase large subunit [Treponema sp.]